MQPIRKMWETPRPIRPAVPSVPAGSGWKKRVPVAVLAVLFLAAAGSTVYFHQKLARERAAAAEAPASGEAQVAALVAQVGKLMVLPEGETPTVATVSDPSKLQDQAFFAHAKEGDKVLIYAHVKKAILYSPADNRIVEVAAIN